MISEESDMTCGAAKCAKGANVRRSYSTSSGTKKAGRPRGIGDLWGAFVVFCQWTSGVACSCSMWVKRRGLVQLQTLLQTMTWADDQLSRRLATFRQIWSLVAGNARLCRERDGRPLKRLPNFCMTGPIVCKTRWSATKTSATIAHVFCFFRFNVRLKRAGFSSEPGQKTTIYTRTRLNSCRKNWKILKKYNQPHTCLYIYIYKNVWGHIILHWAFFGNLFLILFFPPSWVWSHFIYEYIHILCGNLFFFRSATHWLHLRWARLLVMGISLVHPTTHPWPLIRVVHISVGISSQGNERFQRKSPQGKQNRHSNETGTMNRWHSVKCLQHRTIPHQIVFI